MKKIICSLLLLLIVAGCAPQEANTYYNPEKELVYQDSHIKDKYDVIIKAEEPEPVIDVKQLTLAEQKMVLLEQMLNEYYTVLFVKDGLSYLTVTMKTVDGNYLEIRSQVAFAFGAMYGIGLDRKQYTVGLNNKGVNAPLGGEICVWVIEAKMIKLATEGLISDDTFWENAYVCCDEEC